MFYNMLEHNYWYLNYWYLNIDDYFDSILNVKIIRVINDRDNRRKNVNLSFATTQKFFLYQHNNFIILRNRYFCYYQFFPL